MALSSSFVGTPKKKILPLENPTYVDESQAFAGNGLPPATVATKENPVVELTKPKEPTPPFSFPSSQGLDGKTDRELQDMVTWAQVNPSKITPEEKFNLYRAGQLLEERATKKATAVNPYEQIISQEEAKLKHRELQAKQRDMDLQEARRSELEALYAKDVSREQKAGVKSQETAQSGLSFSGFGRSTKAAEIQTDIQNAVNENINILSTAKDAEMKRYKAELAGATAQELAQYDQYINQLTVASNEYNVALADKMNEYNLAEAQTYAEKIDNILQAAQQYDVADLTEEELSQAGSFAELLIDDSGNIDSNLLKQIPPRLQMVALQKAAEVKKEMGAAPDRIELGDGLRELNPDTGEWEHVAGGVKSDWKSDGLGGFWRNNPITGNPETRDGQGPAPSLPNQQQGQTRLNEEPVDTLIPNVYGGTVKLAPTVANMLNNAYMELKQQGIELKIGDSHRSTETQANAYASGKKGVAPPGTSFHEIGQAFDISQRAEDGMFKNGQLDPRVKKALEDAGLQQLPSEPRHWSYGEMGGDAKVEKYTQSQKNMMEGLKNKSLGTVEIRDLKKAGLTTTDVYDYNASQKGLELSDDQRAIYNNQLSSFRGNPTVKAFEEGLQQYQDLYASLSDNSGPGDIAGIYQFMKSLDPTSTIRQPEFDAAAASAGVANKIGNTRDRLLKGKQLTEQQSLAFKKLAKAYVDNRAKNYDRLYGDFERVVNNSKIDNSYLPTKATDALRSNKPVQYKEGTDYAPGTRIINNGKTYVIGDDGNAYEE